MTSDQMVDFVERKLKQHGIEKVVPDADDLATAYALFARSHQAEQIVRRELEEAERRRHRESRRISLSACADTFCNIPRFVGTRRS